MQYLEACREKRKVKDLKGFLVLGVTTEVFSMPQHSNTQLESWQPEQSFLTSSNILRNYIHHLV